MGAAAGAASAATLPPPPATDAERWILDRLQHTLRTVERAIADYRFDLAAQALYEFAWNEYCDWFVELAKPALTGDDEATKASTRRTLLVVLERTLRALHPLVPFVTEEIWHAIAPRLGIAGDSISTQPWPEPDAAMESPAAAADIEWLKAVVTALRSIRSQLGVPPARQVPLLLQGGDADDRARIARHAESLTFLARLSSIADLSGDAPPAAAGIVGDLTLLIPLEGLVDLDAERTRLDKELKRIAAEIGKCEGKLASDTFVRNAPAAVVEQERTRLADWTAQLAALKAQRGKL